MPTLNLSLHGVSFVQNILLQFQEGYRASNNVSQTIRGSSLRGERMCLVQKPDSANTQETCTTYNVLKLARSLFRWTGESRYADWYERALLNGILGTQRTPRRPAHLPQATPLSDGAASKRRMLEDDRYASWCCDQYITCKSPHAFLLPFSS